MCLRQNHTTLSEFSLAQLAQSKVFIMIIGGVASGKSFIYDKYFSDISIIDIDQYIESCSGGDWNNSKQYIKFGIAYVEKTLKETFARGDSVVNTGTGASLYGVQNKLKWAKEQNYITYIVLVDTPLETALLRNRERAQNLRRNLIPEYKVLRTNTQARDNFIIFKNIADYSIIIKS